MAEEEKKSSVSGDSIDLTNVIGQRIACDDHRGKVHYVGTVATSKNAETIWLGIEWDETGRGKHDGAVTTEDGVSHRYFTCPPGMGSFIKPKRAQFGKELVAALMDRYSTDDLDEIVNEQERISAATNYKVEFVGWDRAYRRQCNLDRKKNVFLTNECVSHLENPDILAQTLPAAEMLDLRRNLMTSLNGLRGLNVLSRLRDLNLSHNRFERDVFDAEVIGDSFMNIQVLKMNDVPFAWYFVYSLASRGQLAGLSELEICDVNLNTFDVQEMDTPEYFECFENLTSLNVSANEISEWQQLERFGRLPNLLTVNASYNRLEFIAFQPELFQSLEVLWIRNNNISDLNIFDQLNLFPSIRSLLFINNPMSERLGDARIRDLSIAKVQRLTRCNQSEVQKKERMNAELFYLKWIQQQLQEENDENKESSNSELPPEEIEARFPRYLELVAKHGLTKVKRQEKQSLTMAHVVIKSMDPESCTVPSKEKRVPLSMTIGQMKLLCRRLFNLDPEKQRLQMQPAGKFPEDMGDDTRSLGFYGVKDGYLILMQSTDFGS